MVILNKMPYNSGTRFLHLPRWNGEGSLSAIFTGGVGCDGSPWNPRLTLFGVSSSGLPFVLGTIEDAERLAGCAGHRFKGDYLFIACSMVDRLTVVNVSDPRHPRVVASVQDSIKLHGACDVEIQGNKAYVIGDLGRLTAVDISDPLHPAVGGSSSPFMADPARVVLWDESAGEFIDNPMVFSVDPFDDTAVGDALYIGHSEMFNSVRLNITRPASGMITVQAAYYSGPGGWVPFHYVSNEMWCMEGPGEVDVHWSNLGTDWAPTEVDGTTAYWIKFTIVSVLESLPPTRPLLDSLVIHQPGHEDQQRVFLKPAGLGAALDFSAPSLTGTPNDVPATSDPPQVGDCICFGNTEVAMEIYDIVYSTPGQGYGGSWYFLGEDGEGHPTWKYVMCKAGVSHGWTGDPTSRFRNPNQPGDYIHPNWTLSQYVEWASRPRISPPEAPVFAYWLMLKIEQANHVPTRAEFDAIKVHWSEPDYDLDTLKLIADDTILATGLTHVVKFSVFGGNPSVAAHRRDEVNFHRLKGFDVSGGRAYIANQDAGQLVVLDLSSMNVVGTLTDEEKLNLIADVRLVGDQAIVTGGGVSGGAA